MGSLGSLLSLIARGELGEITVVITLPVCRQCHPLLDGVERNLHLVIEHLGLSRLGLGDQRLVEDVENVKADLLKLELDLLAVLPDLLNVLLVVLGLLLLLDRGDDSP